MREFFYTDLLQLPGHCSSARQGSQLQIEVGKNRALSIFMQIYLLKEHVFMKVVVLREYLFSEFLASKWDHDEVGVKYHDLSDTYLLYEG